MDYVVYRDHSGLVITDALDFETLTRINRALEARTWGEFLDLLPESEHDHVVHRSGIRFGGNIGVADEQIGSSSCVFLGSDK